MVLLFSAFTRTTTPMVLLDQYEFFTSSTSRTLKASILPPQTLRIEIALNQGLGVDFKVQTLQNYTLFALNNISQITYAHQIPVRMAYKFILTNPHALTTLVSIKITMYGLEPDLLLIATIVSVIGIILVTISLILRKLIKQPSKTR